MVQRLLSSLPTFNFDPSSPLHLQAYPGQLGYSVAALQWDAAHQRYLLVGSHSRLWKAKEKLLPPLFLELTAITEGLLELRHLTAYASPINIPCSEAMRKLSSKPTTHHPQAAALLLDMLLFSPTLNAPPVTFSPDLTWGEHTAWQPLPPPELITDPISQAFNLQPPPPAARLTSGPYVHIQFDGGA